MQHLAVPGRPPSHRQVLQGRPGLQLQRPVVVHLQAGGGWEHQPTPALAVAAAHFSHQPPTADAAASAQAAAAAHRRNNTAATILVAPALSAAAAAIAAAGPHESRGGSDCA